MKTMILFLFLFIICGGIFDAGADKKALADDIKSGVLISNPKAQQMIHNGDELLSKASHCINDKWCKSGEDDLYTAFVAKVWFERARLEMEMAK